jgi:hypothetical protein
MQNRHQPCYALAEIMCAVKDLKYFIEISHHGGSMNVFMSFTACIFIEFTSQMIHQGGSHCIIMLDCSMSIDGYADDFKLKSSYQVSGGIFMQPTVWEQKE